METGTEFRMKKSAKKDKHRGAWEHCLDTTNTKVVKAAEEQGSLPIAIMHHRCKQKKEDLSNPVPVPEK